MKLGWGLSIAIFAVAAFAVGWMIWDSNRPAEPAPTAPAAAAPPARSKLAPLQTAAWMLSNARAAPTAPPGDGGNGPPPEDGCGPSGEPCADDALCVDGSCLSALCAPDGGTGARCAVLLGGKTGVCCGEVCTNVHNDARHCGDCETKCRAGADCVAGKCEATSCTGQMAGAACVAPGHPEGACCRGNCADKSTWASNSANCGGCGHACAPGLVCKQSMCVDSETGAAPTWTCLEPAHPCPAGTFCVLDSCLPRVCEGDGLLCPAPGGQLGHCCGQACTDLFEDSNNCRACGVRCPAGQACHGGECVSEAQ